MATLNEYIPQSALHPCVTLNEKLEEINMSRKEFALRTGKPEQTIIAVLKGESSITPEMAILFENITKIPAHFWINKQARFNEFKAREKWKSTIDKASEWAQKFPYTEMAKLNWVPATRKLDERTVNLLVFFAVSSNDAWENLYMKNELKVAAYTSLKHTHDPFAISAWLRQGEIQAAKIDTPAFDARKLKDTLPEIKKLMANQPIGFFTQLQQLCLSCGVKVFYTPKLPKMPISGSTRWINNTPVIQLTARYHQNDRFWFTFFHEAGHILLHGKKYISLENIDFSGADQTKEQQAHNFAEEWTFSLAEEEEVLSAIPLTEEKIVAFAQKFDTHPAMIIGRFHHKGLLPFSVGRSFMEPVNLSPAESQ
jgi:HTH-type transcriptional regulator / antitoxin HigA